MLTMLPRRPAALMAAALALVAAACSGSGDGSGPDPAQEIRTSYQTYATAVSLKDGDAASALVSAATLDYYSRLRDVALTADRAALAKRRVVDQLAVLSMRANVPVATLRSGASQDVVAAAVTHQVISGGGAATTELSDVRVGGDAATASIGIAGDSHAVRLGFRREGGVWKVDLTALLPPAEDSLTGALRREKLTASQMLNQVMTERVGPAKAAKLWDPPGR